MLTSLGIIQGVIIATEQTVHSFMLKLEVGYLSVGNKLSYNNQSYGKYVASLLVLIIVFGFVYHYPWHKPSISEAS